MGKVAIYLLPATLILCCIIWGRSKAQIESTACEPGWVRGEASPESCYRSASMEEQSHSEAVQACASLGAFLVVPSSQAEFDEFRDLTDALAESQLFSWTLFWMGCGDEETEGVYNCVDGTEISEDGNWWAWLQPDNFWNSEDCIVYSRSMRQLLDVSCDSFASTLCEKPAQRLPSRPVLKETKLRRKYGIGSAFQDYCLINHVIDSVEARSVGRCASACSSRDDCHSFTYEGGRQCEMHDVTEEEAAESDFVQRPGCVYYEKI